MHQIQYEFPEKAQHWLQNIIGKSLYCIAFEKGLFKQHGRVAEVNPVVQIEAEACSDALCLDFALLPDSDYSHIQVMASTKPLKQKLASEWQLTDFVVRKIELWAEKTGSDDNKLLSINTILFSSISGEQLLLYPWGPEPWVSITEDTEEINNVLNSGHLYLKQIID